MWTRRRTRRRTVRSRWQQSRAALHGGGSSGMPACLHWRWRCSVCCCHDRRRSLHHHTARRAASWSTAHRRRQCLCCAAVHWPWCRRGGVPGGWQDWQVRGAQNIHAPDRVPAGGWSSGPAGVRGVLRRQCAVGQPGMGKALVGAAAQLASVADVLGASSMEATASRFTRLAGWRCIALPLPPVLACSRAPTRPLNPPAPPCPACRRQTLKPGDLVGVNKDSYLILDTLPAEYDSR